MIALFGSASTFDHIWGQLFTCFIALIPALAYPCICWSYWRIIKYKREVIGQILGTEEAKNLYKKAYAPTSDSQHDPFASLFDVTYHLPSFVVAVIVNMFFVILAAQISLAHFGLRTLLPGEYSAAIPTIPASVVAGMSGAYIWGVYDTLRRYWSAELSTISLHFVWVRLLLFAIFGPVVEAVVKSDFAILVAFGGAFIPLNVLFGFFATQARQRLNIEADFAEGPTLYKLQGFTREVIDRLRDEGIDSVTRLAYADPIRILLRTNMEWKIILDMIDQAALHMFIGDKAAELRPLGIRGGIELSDTLELIRDGEFRTPEEGQQVLAAIAQKLGMDVPSTWNLMVAVGRDVHFQFVRSLWLETEP
jgi:hypothetical protein